MIHFHLDDDGLGCLTILAESLGTSYYQLP